MIFCRLTVRLVVLLLVAEAYEIHGGNSFKDAKVKLGNEHTSNLGEYSVKVLYPSISQ